MDGIDEIDGIDETDGIDGVDGIDGMDVQGGIRVLSYSLSVFKICVWEDAWTCGWKWMERALWVWKKDRKIWNHFHIYIICTIRNIGWMR